MNEKRFPPPGNEHGYREAAAPVVEPVPELPVQPRRVVATLADDPDEALRKASVDQNWIRQQEVHIAARLAARRRATWILALLTLAYVLAVVVFTLLSPRRRR